MLKIFNFVIAAFASVKRFFKRDKIERWSSSIGASKGVPRESHYRSENHSLVLRSIPESAEA
jgi:hypothetical protein